MNSSVMITRTCYDYFCRAMLYASAALAVMRCLSVCLSVCVSVTFVSCAKRNREIFEFFTPSGSQAILLFPHQTGWHCSDGDPHNGGRGMQERYEKITGLYLGTDARWIDRKPHPSFRMVPIWMILSDLWRRFHGHDIIQRQVTKKRHKIELYLQ